MSELEEATTDLIILTDDALPLRSSDSNGAKAHAKRRFPDSLGVGDLALDPRSRIGTYRRD